MSRSTLSLSPAHVFYLEHQMGKRLGSSTPSELRVWIYMLLRDELPKRSPQRKFAQSGQVFACYNQKRVRVDLELRRESSRALARAERTSMSHGDRTPLEHLIDAHAAPLGYVIEDHKCSRWCVGAKPACPGQVHKIQTNSIYGRFGR